MLKLLKHDLKNNWKLCLISLLVGLLGNSFLYALFKNSIMTNTQTLGFVEMLFLILCILAVFGSFLALIVQIVMVFRRDYYSDRGYLMFTLPVRSNDILMSKLLFALIWTVIFAIAFSLINFLGMYFVGESKFLEMIKLAFNNPYFTISPFTFILLTVYFIISTFIGYIVMYFSIVATKSLFPSNKTGYSWIIIMIVINVVISLIDQEIFTRFPYLLICRWRNRKCQRINNAKKFRYNYNEYVHKNNGNTYFKYYYLDIDRSWLIPSINKNDGQFNRYLNDKKPHIEAFFKLQIDI